MPFYKCLAKILCYSCLLTLCECHAQPSTTTIHPLSYIKRKLLVFQPSGLLRSILWLLLLLSLLFVVINVLCASVFFCFCFFISNILQIDTVHSASMWKTENNNLKLKCLKTATAYIYFYPDINLQSHTKSRYHCCEVVVVVLFFSSFPLKKKRKHFEQQPSGSFFLL